MTTERRRLEERQEIARRDLEELAEQVEAGEIDAGTAEELRTAYQQELDEATAALGALPRPGRKAGSRETAKPPPEKTAAAPEIPQPRSVKRTVIGSVLVMAALTAAILFAARDVSPDSAPQGTAAAGPGGLTVDPASVSNEQLEEVVAANPDINAMRLALADRYFEAQDYGRALEHYLFIAENNPTPAEESRSLARVGWMAYITNQPEAAEQYVQTALNIDPTNEEAKLFIGFILLYGLNDAEAAVPWLEEIAALPDLPESILTQVEDALADARSQRGDG